MIVLKYIPTVYFYRLITMVKITIKHVIGKAGTGKTTYAKRVAEHHIKRNKKVYCLSFTHSAVENMKRRGFNGICEFSTLHSFFRIDYNGEVIGCFKYVDVIIIDEFSLIASALLDKCIKSIFKAGDSLCIKECEIYLIGDPLQLGAVNLNDSITYKLLNEAFSVIPIESIPVDKRIPIIKHWGSLCINSPTVKELTTKTLTLTTNHRSEDKLMKLVDTVVMNGDITSILPLIVTVDDVVKRIRNESYIVLASKYDVLQKINSRVRIEKNTLKYHDWLYIENEPVYMTINSSSIYNGEQVTLITADESSITIENDGHRNIITDQYLCNVDSVKVNDKIPLAMPSYLYTFHKSQGMEFENVAICIDDLFEFPMLYTGITRARKNVIFFTLNSLLLNDIDKTIKLSKNEESYRNFLSISDNRDKLNEYLHERINTGTTEIRAINDIYNH